MFCNRFYIIHLKLGTYQTFRLLISITQVIVIELYKFTDVYVSCKATTQYLMH